MVKTMQTECRDIVSFDVGISNRQSVKISLDRDTVLGVKGYERAEWVR